MPLLIPHPKKLKTLLSQIKRDGFKNLHILCDFDGTLTYGSIQGTKVSSIMSTLRDGNHLTKDYAVTAHALFNKYHPIEIDLKIPLVKRKKFMQEWWDAHNKLLIASGLAKCDLQDIVKNGPLQFREGVADFLDFLFQHRIPLVIFSASGCGDAIQLFFQKYKKDFPNVFYVTNQFNWDKNGKALSKKGTIIHSLNKDETILETIPKVFSQIKNRRNVILLGDNIEDIGMIKGFDFKNLLKIGFLNYDYDKLRGAYKKKFDVVLEGDGSFDKINDLLEF